MTAGVLSASAAQAQTATRFVSATASSARAGYPASNAIDGSYGTRWSALGAGQSLTGDLGRVMTVSAVGVGWYQGAYRSYTYRLEAAGADGVFRAVRSGTSARSSSPQRYDITPVAARWIRIVVNGNNVNTEASITEAGTLATTAPPATVAVSISPTTATLAPGGTRQFTATVTGATDTGVTWSVAEGAAGGAVSASGLYTAPSTPGTYRVVATSRADPTRSATATVTVQASQGGGRVLAFPGAEGFGALATGGRGGRVLKVTNLNASGPGSLQAALDVDAPRIVVFAVSGVIPGNVTVTHGDVTIAGQTAPGGGITIAGRLFGRYAYDVQNIVVRHVRVRPPRCASGCDGSQYDAIQFSRNSRLILDHVSVAQGADETVDLYEADDVTVQWSTIEASQQTSAHPDGTTHNYGLIHGPNAQRISYHHNLCAHHSRRCPAIANGPADVRNNVAYNVRHAFLHTNPAQGPFNFVGNFFKQGPNDSLLPYFFDDEDRSASTRTSYYLRDSYVDDPGQLVGSVDDPWSMPSYFTSLYLDASHRSATEFDFTGTVLGGYPPITTQGAQAAYDLVLSRAGAFPRDGFTTTTVEQTRNRTGAWNPSLPSNLMAGLTPGAPPADADGDGMGDEWERSHGLDPANGGDHARVMPSGYTAIEEYVNGLADALLP